MNRREFLKRSMVVVAGMAVPAAALHLIDPKQLLAAKPELRWAFLVDAYKCVGCGFCVKACKLENEVPYEANVSRTWVERYVVKKDGEVLIDSPKAARDGFTTKKIEVGEGKFREVKDEEIEKAFFVPKLCNQCENPPCVQVCPVGATYATADGVVLVDRKWCIGCGYCIMGCPYGVRFFHPVHKTAEKCNFCYHRITKGMKSACVDACPFGARQIGNLRDPDDPVTKVIMTERVGILKEEYGTKPQVYYIGLSKEVR
ncbi:oxidoreductase, iron-sulfur cluster-binding subunit [Geobacter metallireducens RCH3]|uniref:Menaquinol oxidoreductase complex Cbc4, iron-sulfur cluster-binding subunit, putative n=1 Tax=Geobacter metallireducens (strain ATCC 53774 / DSM 7210 / GS-15) TaxID=269799 RepID=Q39PV0_GEOMG|nr:4Fe-4S dicluster domain-containing protein [Geobacter metallireducens]ABB33724.1 menaquinol oxidoreductase complex Cbc4, iron-sulfur cluster-binding subunit, putative [Geobacter metallireducens GS-15]EHP85825.1 oxidoreductase, iron-sulfur cluster-binding subunit [Geobacter metallireducens RCH3]